MLFAAPFMIEGNEVHITTSIGISRYAPERQARDWGGLLIEWADTDATVRPIAKLLPSPLRPLRARLVGLTVGIANGHRIKVQGLTFSRSRWLTHERDWEAIQFHASETL
jgi:hypothetical protein